MAEVDRSDLLRRLFHLIGLEAEELVALALDGQGGEAEPVGQRELARKTRDVGEKILIVADALEALC